MAESKYIFAVGRRKTSTASVRLYEGKDVNKINGKKVEETYTFAGDVSNLLSPLKAVEKEDMYFTAMVKGGGKISQLNAVKHGIARALVKYDESFRPMLKKFSLLTRDPRMVERKKTGLKKARKAPQFSKR